nr:MFS transporter [Rhodoferax sp.]
MNEAKEHKPLRSVLWLLTVGHGLTHWYPATFYLLLPLIGMELGLSLSYSQIGLAMTCQFIAGALANVPGGMLVDTVGKKGGLLALSLFWVGFPYLIIGLSNTYWMLLVCISLVGVGNNLWHPAAIQTLAHRFPERKGLALSVHSMGGNVGDALAPLAIGALLVTFTWREIVVMNVVPGVFMGCLILLYLGTLRFGAGNQASGTAAEGQSVGEYVRGLRKLFSNRTLIMLSVSSAFRSLTQNTLLTFLSLFLAYEMHYSPLWVGAGMFVLHAAGLAGLPIAGHLSDTMGRRRIIMTSMAMTAVVLSVMAFTGPSQAIIPLIAFLGLFLYAILPVMQAMLLDATPKKMGGTSIGMLFGMQSAGSSVGPIIGGMLADLYGLPATFHFLAMSIVLAGLFIFFVPTLSAVGKGCTEKADAIP